MTERMTYHGCGVLRRARVGRIVLCVACLLANGCGRQSSPEPAEPLFYFNVAGSGWDTIVYMNDNPVCRGGAFASIIQEMSPWMQEGENRVRIVTTRVSDSPFTLRTCDIRFVRVTDPSDAESVETVGGIYDSPAELDNYETEFIVDSPRATKWPWQRADTLSDLTDVDRAQIMDIIQDMASELRHKDADAVLKRFAANWDAGPCTDNPSARKKLEESAREQWNKVFAFPDYTVTVAKMEELEFFAGRQIVLVTKRLVGEITMEKAAENAIVSAGHAADFKPEPEGWSFGLSYDQLRFVKVDGEWLLVQ